MSESFQFLPKTEVRSDASIISIYLAGVLGWVYYAWKGGWDITTPSSSSVTYIYNDVISVGAEGTGTPDGSFSAKAWSKAGTGSGFTFVGVYNNGTVQNGRYSYGYPQPKVAKTSVIDPTAGTNTVHAVETNTIYWGVSDGGGAWYTADFQDVDTDLF